MRRGLINNTFLLTGKDGSVKEEATNRLLDRELNQINEVKDEKGAVDLGYKISIIFKIIRAISNNCSF